MYRAHFVFDIGELRALATPPLRRLAQRRGLSERELLESLFRAWLRYALHQVGYLDLFPDRLDQHRDLFDGMLLDELEPAADELYRHISQALFLNAHPCMESPCEVCIYSCDLWLTFHV